MVVIVKIHRRHQVAVFRPFRWSVYDIGRSVGGTPFKDREFAAVQQTGAEWEIAAPVCSR